MFSRFMVNAWEVSGIVAVVGGLVGFFVVLRGSAFVAHAIPTGSFAGAACAALLGVNALIGLGVFAGLGALAIGTLGRRGRHDAVTALTLVLMLALGSLFLTLGSEYEPAVNSLLFGEVLGVGSNQLVPTIALGAVSVLAIGALNRPLLLSSALPEVAEARGISRFGVQSAFLLVVALATTMTVPVVGALLIFSVMVGAPAAARSFVDRPGAAMALSVLFALAIVWSAMALSYSTDYPVGFFVGTLAAAAYGAGRAWSGARARVLRVRARAAEGRA